MATNACRDDNSQPITPIKNLTGNLPGRNSLQHEASWRHLPSQSPSPSGITSSPGELRWHTHLHHFHCLFFDLLPLSRGFGGDVAKPAGDHCLQHSMVWS